MLVVANPKLDVIYSFVLNLLSEILQKTFKMCEQELFIEVLMTYNEI